MSNIKVAVIPISMFKDLQIKENPDWLKAYKNGENEVSRLLKLGSTHNAWNQSDRALIYLQKLEQIEPKYKGLSYELSFAYNALKEYEKAILILDKALIADPKNCELYKELLYAQMNLKQVDKAMDSSKLAYDVCSDKNFRMQILRDLMYHYYTKKDKEQFKIWAKKAKIEMATVPGALQGIAKWEAELNK